MVTARRAARLTTTIVSIVVVIALALVAGACSSSGKSSSTETSAKNFSVTLPSGQASLSLTGALPPGWPSSFPLPAGAKAAGSGSIGGSSSTTRVAVYTTSMAPKDAYDFYATNTDLQPSDQSSVGIGSAFVGKMKFSGTYTGSLAVLGRQDTTYIVIALQSETAPTSTTVA